jgi:ElaA protein
MNSTWTIKPFADLTTFELYDLLRLRSDVFVVEQHCVYPDVDGKDKYAWHVIGYADGHLVAYARLFKAGDYFDNASIGRVVTKFSARNTGLGHQLMKEAVKALFELIGTQTIEISAQQHLEAFYNAHGFVSKGESYLEDDIPHIRMFYTPNE